jgi:hypothetical protein
MISKRQAGTTGWRGLGHRGRAEDPPRARRAPGATPGELPQVAGISFGFDPSASAQVSDANGVTTPGVRVTDLYVDTNRDGAPDTALYQGGGAQVAASNTYNLVTLDFLANGGDDYPHSTLAAANRRQLYAGRGFGDPDANNDGQPDFPVLTGCDPGRQSGFSATGQEQDALAEYFLQLYPSQMMPFTAAETPPADDRRIQNLSVIPAFVAP